MYINQYTNIWLARVCGVTRQYVTKVLKDPGIRSEKAKMIRRMHRENLAGIVGHPLFKTIIRRYKPKTRQEEDLLFEWINTHNILSDFKNKIKDIR